MTHRILYDINNFLQVLFLGVPEPIPGILAGSRLHLRLPVPAGHHRLQVQAHDHEEWFLGQGQENTHQALLHEYE